MRLGRFLAVAAAVLLLAPAAAVAQSSIAGTVTDDTGGVLPGVTVEASSDVLIEGSRVVFTDGTGAYNIIDLRPGEYTVVFTLPGFGTLVRDQLILGADVTLPIDVQMSVGSVEETITVSGETPVVDVQQVQRIEVMTRETQEAIPTGRSMWSYALLIPGVKVHKPDVGGTAGVQQSEMMGRGLDAAHTTIEVDGMMINTMISDGRYQAYLNPMLAAEDVVHDLGSGRRDAERRAAHQHDPERGRQPVQRELVHGLHAGQLAGEGPAAAGAGPGSLAADRRRPDLRQQRGHRGPDLPRPSVVLLDGPVERGEQRDHQQHQPRRHAGSGQQHHPQRERAADVADDAAAQDLGDVRQGSEAPVQPAQPGRGPEHGGIVVDVPALRHRDGEVDGDAVEPDAGRVRVLAGLRGLGPRLLPVPRGRQPHRSAEARRGLAGDLLLDAVLPRGGLGRAHGADAGGHGAATPGTPRRPASTDGSDWSTAPGSGARTTTTRTAGPTRARCPTSPARTASSSG